MTVDELWKNLQPYMKKVDSLESEMHEVKGKVTNVETEMHEVKGKVTNLETEMHEVKDTVNNLESRTINLETSMHNLESEMHIVKDVDMTTMLKRQEEIRDELKQEIREMGDKLCNRIDQYIQKHEVVHKRIEYQIADLEWKNRIAN